MVFSVMLSPHTAARATTESGNKESRANGSYFRTVFQLVGSVNRQRGTSGDPAALYPECCNPPACADPRRAGADAGKGRGGLYSLKQDTLGGLTIPLTFTKGLRHPSGLLVHRHVE
jgi:hypothetical protein